MVASSGDNGATSAGSIIKRMIEASGVKNQAALADVLGISPQAVNNAKSRNAIPAGWILLLAEKFRVSPSWLVFNDENAHWSAEEYPHARTLMGTDKGSFPVTRRAVYDQVDGEHRPVGSEMFVAQPRKKNEADAHTNLQLALQMLQSAKEEVRRLQEENLQLKLQLEIYKMREEARAAPENNDPNGFKESA